ncbi:MAG: AAA family ATPase, partial [Candidatus Omnitrophota bacterium]|nr:AAA family ATPase [Candidatus Omnitrophota bacterium]
MPDLFESQKKTTEKKYPLAVRMRPRNLKEFIGQEHILGEGKLLKRAIDADRITSLILYGPPGTGKTTLASLVANVTKSYFQEINAVLSNVQELKDSIKAAKERERANNKKTILFIDEIHRFNKSQQDVLMPDVEKGNPVLIGATTHNPFFSLVSPLISRSIVFELKKLSKENIIQVLKNAMKDK